MKIIWFSSSLSIIWCSRPGSFLNDANKLSIFFFCNLHIFQFLLKFFCPISTLAIFQSFEWNNWSVRNNGPQSTQLCGWLSVNSSPPGQNGRHFADDIFRCIFVNEKFYILIKISLKFVPKGSIDNTPALVWIMAWRRIGDKPLSEPMLT